MMGNVKPPTGIDKREVKCLKCGEKFWLHIEHVCKGLEMNDTPHSSAAATGQTTTVRAMRLVLQLEDTPTNREFIELASAAIQKLNRTIEGKMGVLKVEEINIIKWIRPEPLPNEKGQP